MKVSFQYRRGVHDCGFFGIGWRHALCALTLALSACGGGGGGGAADPAAPPVVVPPTTQPPVVAAGIRLITGSAAAAGSLDGTGRSAYFNGAAGLAFDRAGNLIVVDAGNATLRKIDSAGAVTTLAGRPGVSVVQDGQGADSLFAFPGDLAMAPDGTMYVTDGIRLRRVTPQGEVTTLETPRVLAVAVAPDGTVYLGGTGAIYRMVPGSPATLFAGQPVDLAPWYAVDGVGTAARFPAITSLTVDARGNLYVSHHTQHTIRRITPDGVVSTLAGQANQMGSVDGIGTDAQLAMPGPLTVDAQGFLWVVERGSGVFRRISPNGEVTSPFGNALPLFPNFHTQVRQLAFAASGDLYFSMPLGVARITPDGRISSFVGQDFASGTPLRNVRSLASDAAGHAVLSILELPPNEVARVVVHKLDSDGTELPVVAGDSSNPVVDAAGNRYLAGAATRDMGINATRPVGGALFKETAQGQYITLAEWAADSPGAIAPSFAAVARDGTLYFIDLLTGNLVQWTAATGARPLAKVGAAVITTTFLGKPWSLAVDAAGSVYVLTATRLQRYENGAMVTVAGVEGQRGHTDGPGAQTRFSNATELVADGIGNLYLADGARIRKFAVATGEVTTVAGHPAQVGLRTGPLPGGLGLISRMAMTAVGTLLAVSDNALIEVRLP